MLSELIEQLSKDPFNQKLNLKAALEYEKLNQTASAISFYQRTAEYGEGLYVYAALLRMSICLQKQGDREATVMQNAMQAVTYNPDRPEAYFRIAQIHERHARWQECYTWASMGISKLDGKPLPADVEYPGQYGLRFEQAVSAWWIGRKDESIELFLSLLEAKITDEYRNAIESNLERLGYAVDPVNSLEPIVMNYRKFFGSKAPIIFDIGTRDGKDANYLSENLKSSSVYAIDANPIAVEKTKNDYPSMIVIEGAISDYDGETTFQQVNSGDANMDGCSSLYAEKVANEPQFQGKVSIIPTTVSRMDTIMSNYNISQIDVAKIDVEGYSWEVLHGFGERLHDVKLLHLETEQEPTHSAHKNAEEIKSFLSSKGFVLVDTSYEGSNGIGRGIEDQIWINPNLATRNVAYFTSHQIEEQ